MDWNGVHFIMKALPPVPSLRVLRGAPFSGKSRVTPFVVQAGAEVGTTTAAAAVAGGAAGALVAGAAGGFVAAAPTRVGVRVAVALAVLAEFVTVGKGVIVAGSGVEVTGT